LKNILYLSYDGLTDPLGQSQVLPYLVYLSEKGYRFTILSFEKAERLKNEGAVIRDITAKAGIRWVPLHFTSRPPVLAKAWDRWRMKQVAFSLQRKHGYSMAHCRSYVAAEVGLELKKAFGTKLLFDMRGFWADEKIDNGQWNQQQWLYRRLYKHYKGKEREFLLSADAIISLTEAARSYLLQQPGYQQLPITVIPCCADLAHFDYRKVDASEVKLLRTSLGFDVSHKIMLYLGSVGGWYLTGEMFRFFKLLHAHQPLYRMLVLTKDNPEEVKKEATSQGIDPQCLTVTYVARKHLPLYLAASQCGIFFIRRTFSKMASSPTKHAELMGMGLPVICNAIGDTGNIIKATGTGLLVDAFDAPTLAKAAAQVAQIEDLDKTLIRSSAFKYFDLQEGGARYAAIYAQQLAAPEPATGPALHA
jgi:glycosyltransferase involved in cell wall biosynthesis